MLDTHKEDDIRNTEINDIRKIKRGRRREGYGIRTPNGDDINPSAWGHLNPSTYCDVGRLFYGVFKLCSKLQRKK